MNTVPDARFDVALVGTSLPLSIAAAALAKAGYNVLHLDANEYYGGDSASLTLKEIQAWADYHISHPEAHYSSISLRYPASDASHEQILSPDLIRVSRHYSISLSPSVIPSTGLLIDSLVKSGVSRYGGFRLLEGIALYTSAGGVDPSIVRVPSSKEDVFKDKGMSLMEKRKLMKFLLWNIGQFEDSAEIQGNQDSPFQEFLRGRFSLSPSTSSAIAYAIAHSPSDQEATFPALIRSRRYLRSAGRYGNSSFLVGHYGGLGELAQGFCRSCAVQGGTYILGRKVTHITRPSEPSTSDSESKTVEDSADRRFSLVIDGVPETLYANVIISSRSSLPDININTLPRADSVPPAQKRSLARAIAIFDHAIAFPAPVAKDEQESTLPRDTDTFVVIFPPGCLGNEGQAKYAVEVLVTGEGTVSCPRGQYIVYLSTPVETTSHSDDIESNIAETLLRPYLEKLLSLPSPDDKADISNTIPPTLSSSEPILELFYLQHLVPSDTSIQVQSGLGTGIVLADDAPPYTSTLTEVADVSAMEGERLFWEAVRILWDDKAREEGVVETMWPPLNPEEEQPGVDAEDW